MKITAVAIITIFTMSNINAADNLPEFHTIQGSLNLLAVADGGKYKLLNRKTGDFVSPAAYDDIYGLYACSACENNVVVVKSDTRYGLIDALTGQEIVSPSNSPVNRFTDDIYLNCNPLNWLINGKTEQLTAVPIYVEARWGYRDELNPVIYYYNYSSETYELGNFRMGYCDKSGKEIIPPIYNFAASFANGVAIVEINKKYGAIDLNGKQIIPLEYDDIQNITIAEALQVGKKTGDGTTLYGITDRYGNEIIPVKYKDVHINLSVDEDIRFIYINNKCGMMNANNRIILPPNRFENLDLAIKGDFGMLNGKWGIISPKGKILLPAKYDSIALYWEGAEDTFIVSQKGKYLRIDSKGKVLEKYDKDPFPEVIKMPDVF